jgi:O-acetyl-ADP-ribose deacetylase (regulator of RNase III)
MDATCFVIMPYGTKPDVDGTPVDFDLIYRSMIRPAVAAVQGLACERCDDLEQPGWIHERMLRHIFEDRVAIVDTSTLNPNVFYELGVRHALRRSVTVLIRRAGTSAPFNIAGLSQIEYDPTETGMALAQEKIRASITNGLRATDETDSLVYYALPELTVRREAKRLTRFEVFRYRLRQAPDRIVGFVTGDREDITIGDVWVSSENTNMQIDSFFGKSTSATIRYLGARKDHTGAIVEDTIADDLRARMGTAIVVPAGTVLATRAGDLIRNGVKWIFHVAAVAGEPREGYRPVARIDQCVKNALRLLDDEEFAGQGLASIVFPIFGTGPGGGSVHTHAEVCVEAAVEHVLRPATSVREIYFYVWSDTDLETCQAIASNHPELEAG